MIWTKKNDGTGPSWFSGIYKITQYDRDLANHLGIHYRAYFIRKGDRCWGYHPYPETPWYRTLTATQAACAKHMEENNGNRIRTGKSGTDLDQA